MVTATTFLAQITCILHPATSTKRTSEIQARVLLMGLNHPVATAIPITVTITLTTVLATNTESTSVAWALALVSGHLLTPTAITLSVPITLTPGHVTKTKVTSATPVMPTAAG